MSRKQNVKTLVLTVLIAIAAILRMGPVSAAELEKLTVAGGCFWCVESDFESVPGVIEAVSGYAGGTTSNPTYKQVGKGGTGHLETVQITFDPAMVSRKTLLEKFLRSVDPTDAGGQFCDRGQTYTTAIFVSNNAERTLAEAVIRDAEKALGQPIVTPVRQLKQFYPAEAYHQNYSKGNKVVLTRFGPKRQSVAYKKYRKACGRDLRVKELWGPAAFPS